MLRAGRAAGTAGWILGSAAFLLALTAPASALGATIRVKSNEDEFGLAGNCTLREAVQTANTDADFGGCKRKQPGAGPADKVVLQGKTEYPIAISGGNDDMNVTGDFDIASRITFEVEGPGRASIDANEMDRAIDVLGTGNLRASDLQIANGNPPTNNASQGGAGILNQGRLTLSRSELTLNDALNGQAINGGALHAFGKSTILDRVDINHNTAANIGGGIAYGNGRLRISNSVISENTANSSGGGILIGGPIGEDPVLLKRTTVSGNTSFADGANFGGGGISVSYFGEGTLKATNVTVSGNTAFSHGGGVFSYAGDLLLNGATVTSNTANFDGDADGKGGGAAGGGLTFHNSIVAGNEDASATNPQQDCAINVDLFKGHNIVGLDGGCDEGNTNKPVVDPGLGPLTDNGGPTPTQRPQAGSDAIGHAGKDAPKNDQRGVKRDDEPDAGAVER